MQLFICVKWTCLVIQCPKEGTCESIIHPHAVFLVHVQGVLLACCAHRNCIVDQQGERWGRCPRGESLRLSSTRRAGIHLTAYR